MSRDFSDLKLVKLNGWYCKLQDLGSGVSAPTPNTTETLRLNVTKVDETPNMLIVKTSVGAGHLVAVALEKGDYEEIVGTIGGDDTVFIATRSPEDTKSLKAKIIKSLE